MTGALTEALLAKVFGEASQGDTLESRARTSPREFVRGQNMLAEASPAAKGRRLSAFEALRIFGFEVLRTAVEDGQAAIVADRTEPARTLKGRREELGLSIASLARLAGLKTSEVTLAETAGKVSPVRSLERLAPWLAIDERYLGYNVAESRDPALGVRFRRLANAEVGGGLSPTAVLKLAEAAWIIARHGVLARELGDELNRARASFRPDANYNYPTYQVGYRLAERTRKLLDIDSAVPIKNLRRLIEDRLKIPLVETELGPSLAGATIANGAHRGIVVNIEGKNENVWIRRMTLAHELGHLLWDPSQKLESLMVDRYDEIEGPTDLPTDPVETRANAFAIALLAPPGEVERIVRDAGDPSAAIAQVSDQFGVSITASRRHIQNVCGLERIQLPKPAITPSDDWKAQEDYTNDFFPLSQTPVARRGRFAWTVVTAWQHHLISLDTAATLLASDPATTSANAQHVLQLTGP